MSFHLGQTDLKQARKDGRRDSEQRVRSRRGNRSQAGKQTAVFEWLCVQCVLCLFISRSLVNYCVMKQRSLLRGEKLGLRSFCQAAF